MQILVQENNENRIIRKTTKASGGGIKNSKSITVPANTQTSESTQAAKPIVNEEDTTEVITGEVEPVTDAIELNEQDRLIAAANLRVAFGELKSAVDKFGLDKITTDLLAEISKYFESAQKKGGV